MHGALSWKIAHADGHLAVGDDVTSWPRPDTKVGMGPETSCGRHEEGEPKRRDDARAGAAMAMIWRGIARRARQRDAPM